MSIKVRPLYDRIVVKRADSKEQVRGGIIIPDTAKEKPQEAEVVAVGDGKYSDDGKRIKLDDVEYTILREDEVLAIVE